MKTVSILEKFENGMHYIMVDPETVDEFLKKGQKRAICRLNGQVEFHCAFISIKDGGHYIYVGSAARKKLGIKQGSQVEVIFVDDTTDYQFEMPEEFGEVLKQDKKANDIFHSLSPGNQRGLISLVTRVKSSDKRIERSFKIAESLKKGITSPREIK